MSLRKKIIIGFFISASIIAILSAFEYVNFTQVRNAMRFLEMTDSVRTKSLQLRRYEKNYFLFPERAGEEAETMQDYLAQLDGLTDDIKSSDPDKAAVLKELVATYRAEFGTIETKLSGISQHLESMKASYPQYERLFPLIKADARDKPQAVADYLQDDFSLPADNPQVAELKDLDSRINTLRQTGEDIIAASREFDNDARDNAEQGIRRSEVAILIFFPLSLAVGVGALLYISTGVVRRLKKMTEAVEKIGERHTPVSHTSREEKGRKDEVDILVEKFNNMDCQLNEWEAELDRKNEELFQARKLAAIGTMASGVAHELNNPLNNISISAQVLKRQVGDEPSHEVREVIDDIYGQTARLKGIVGDLLEFAGEREPQFTNMELNRLIKSAYELVSKNVDTGGIHFALDSDSGGVNLFADPEQLERVFVNLFTNAVAAMGQNGNLTVQVESEEDAVKVRVSDTGKGISEADRGKIFDPFFTMKEKGTGLGLAIVMNIIRKHGGNISVAGEEGKGTVFEINFPRRSV